MIAKSENTMFLGIFLEKYNQSTSCICLFCSFELRKTGIRMNKIEQLIL